MRCEVIEGGEAFQCLLTHPSIEKARVVFIDVVVERQPQLDGGSDACLAQSGIANTLQDLVPIAGTPVVPSAECGSQAMRHAIIANERARIIIRELSLRLTQQFFMIVNQTSNFSTHLAGAQKMEGDGKFTPTLLNVLLDILQAKAHTFLLFVIATWLLYRKIDMPVQRHSANI